MRLKEFQVKQLCQKILFTLRNQQLMTLKVSETDVLRRMEEIFLKDLRIEDEINREAQRLLDEYEAKAGGKIDRQVMFQLIKKQLVKQRGVVL